MASQQPFNIYVDSERMIFPTEVSPFIFGESKDIIQRLLEDANARAENYRQTIIGIQQQVRGGSLASIQILAVLTLVCLPCFCYYFNSKQKLLIQSTTNMVQSWEHAAKAFNEKLVNKGVFVRLVTQSIILPYGRHGRTMTQLQYSYEFSFSNYFTVAHNHPIPVVMPQDNFK